MSAEDHFHHVRDFGYFEVPAFLTSAKTYSNIGDVPWYVKQTLHLHNPTVEQVNQALVGKVLIPQPFAGTAKNPRIHDFKIHGPAGCCFGALPADLPRVGNADSQWSACSRAILEFLGNDCPCDQGSGGSSHDW